MSGKGFWAKVNAAMKEIDSSSVAFVLCLLYTSPSPRDS